LIVIRGCKCAMSMKAARTSRPNFSSPAVLWAAVRAGQLSTRRKIIRVIAARMSTTSVTAIGQANRPRTAAFEIECWTFSVGRFLFRFKKVPPPTPDGREGRLFPPEQSWKTALLVIELTGRRNKILHELMRRGAGFAKKLSIFRACWVRRLAIGRDETQPKACGNSLRAF